MEIIKEYKDGKIISDKVERVLATTLQELVNDSDIVAILITKDGNVDLNCILTKNDKIKNSVSSVQYKDYINQKKKEQKERNCVRIIRKEKFAKRNISLPEPQMITLSGCSLNAQRIFWYIYDADITINRPVLLKNFSFSSNTVDRSLKELLESHLIVRVGTKKLGHYEISENIRQRVKDNSKSNNDPK